MFYFHNLFIFFSFLTFKYLLRKKLKFLKIGFLSRLSIKFQVFGKYFKSLQKFFDKSKADDIIKILGDNIKFKDLNIILTEFEAQGTDSNISILERFEQLGMVEKKANFVKSILQGYQRNNRDFSEKISKNNQYK